MVIIAVLFLCLKLVLWTELSKWIAKYKNVILRILEFVYHLSNFMNQEEAYYHISNKEKSASI